MAVVRPFRALRLDPARVDPGAIVADARNIENTSRDPRHISTLVQATDTGALFALLDQARAGVWKSDVDPALTVIRIADDGGERLVCFAAIRSDSHEGLLTSTIDNRVPVDVVPAQLAFSDRKGRVTRAMDAETDRAADATFQVGNTAIEVWVVDDDSAAARIAALLEGAELRVIQPAPASPLSEPRRWVLACFVDEESAAGFVPVGVCALVGAGALQSAQPALA
jgi:hypothetical protein